MTVRGADRGTSVPVASQRMFRCWNCLFLRRHNAHESACRAFYIHGTPDWPDDGIYMVMCRALRFSRKEMPK